MAAQGTWRQRTIGGLRIIATDKGGGETFRRFFAGFDAAFVLPNEKEDAAGFKACLDLNHGGAYRRLSGLYGPYRELCLLAQDADGGAEIGGANFIAMPAQDGLTVTANLNYIFINPGVRGQGYFPRLADAVREVVAGLFQTRGSVRVLVFIEQNDPFRMSSEDYARDTRFTGLDQFDRLRIWAKRGAKVVDFPYRQPPLSAAQDVDDTLVYSVLGAEGDALDACLFAGHLSRFFGVSVLKGAPLGENCAAQEQIDAAQRACAATAPVALLDPAPLLAKIGARDDIARLWDEPPESFRAALRTPTR